MATSILNALLSIINSNSSKTQHGGFYKAARTTHTLVLQFALNLATVTLGVRDRGGQLVLDAGKPLAQVGHAHIQLLNSQQCLL